MAGGVSLLLMALMFGLVWKEGSPLPRAKAGAAAGLLGRKLVLAGGTTKEGGVKVWLQDVDVYDTDTGHWQKGPPMPKPLSYGAYVNSTEELEVFGGTDGQRVYRQIWKLNLVQSTWSVTGTLPTGDILLARAARIGTDIYLFGGCPDLRDLTGCTNTVLRREEHGEWKAVSALPAGPTAMPALAVAGGRIYLFGGCHMASPGNVINRDEAYEYNPATGFWRRISPLPEPNRGASAVAVDSRHIYIFGGYTAPHEPGDKVPPPGFSSAVMVYDIVTDRYQQTTPLKVGLLGIDFFLIGDSLVGAGGEDPMTGRSSRTVVGRLEKSR